MLAGDQYPAKPHCDAILTIHQQCSASYSSENIVTILPTNAADIEKLVNRAKDIRERGLTHSLRKVSGSGKKRKKNGEALASEETAREMANLVDGDETKTKSNGKSAVEHTIKNAATASLTARVLEDEKARKKRQKLSMNENLKGLFSGKASEKTAQRGDFMTRGYSIPTAAKR